jgi:PAS domain S-box-containing protein
MEVDYKLAFDLAPVGLALSRNRTIMDCNQHICEMFGATREQLVGQSFLILYPSVDEYERIGVRMLPILNTTGMYSDNRIMKRVDGNNKGEVFWCHVTGRALNRSEPHEAGICTFEDLSSGRPPDGRLDLQGNWPRPHHQPPHRGDLPGAPDAQVQGFDHGRSGSQAVGRLASTRHLNLLTSSALIAIFLIALQAISVWERALIC